MKKNPKISVIATAYNVEKFIARCIESVLSQDFTDYEFIIILDKPTDSTEEIVKEYAEKDKRIKIISNKNNVGCGMSRRIAIKEAKGDYVMLIDGDDWIRSKALSNLYKEAIKRDADIASGHVLITDEDEKVIGELRTLPGVHSGHRKVTALWDDKLYWYLNNKLVRRSLYDKVEYCGRRYIEDSPTVVKLLYFANKVVYTDYFVYYYRMNPASLTHTHSDFKQFVFHSLAWLDMIEFLKEHDEELLKKFHPERFCGMMSARLREIKFTKKDINEFRDEFDEMCIRFFNSVTIVESCIDFGRRVKLEGKLAFLKEALSKIK